MKNKNFYFFRNCTIIVFLNFIILLVSSTDHADAAHLDSRQLIYRTTGSHYYYYDIKSYDGEINSAGLPDGTGTMVFKNGDSYTGNFCKGIRCGNGVLNSTSGYTYEGIFNEDGLSKGKIYTKNKKLIFEGTCKSGSPAHGTIYTQNIIETMDIILEGEFSSWDLNGLGRKYYIYKDKESADQENTINSILSHTQASLADSSLSDDKDSNVKPGIKYLDSEGYFVANKLNGKGKKYNGKNLKEEGEFKDDKLHGKGRLYIGKKILFDGYFWKGEKVKKPAKLIIESNGSFTVSDFMFSKDGNQILVVPEEDIKLTFSKQDYLSETVSVNLAPGEVKVINCNLEIDRKYVMSKNTSIYRIGYAGRYLGPLAMLKAGDDEFNDYYPDTQGFFLEYLSKEAVFRFTYRSYEGDKVNTNVYNIYHRDYDYKREQQEMYSFDAGLRKNFSKYFLFMQWDLYFGAHARLYFSNAYNDEKANYFFNVGLVGIAGIETAIMPNVALFAEYNNGIVLTDSEVINIEGHQFYAGITYRGTH